MDKKLVVVAMSGGVDSSTTAYLLQKEGYNIVGATMRLIDDEKTEKAINDAKEVCQKLGIKHYVFDLTKEFKEIVINNFIESYKSGQTPNPCVLCNKKFKFGLFYKKAKEELNADYIATGHYAKVENGKKMFLSTLLCSLVFLIFSFINATSSDFSRLSKLPICVLLESNLKTRTSQVVGNSI